MPQVAGFVTCRVRLLDVFDLRHAVLRTGLPRETAQFEGDNDPNTWHVALYLSTSGRESDRPLCCASFMLNMFKSNPAWQLRGMATEPRHQKEGHGKALLSWAEHEIPKRTGVRTMWCNARVPAVRFYEKQGWTRVSDVFDIKDVGPHMKMVKTL